MESKAYLVAIFNQHTDDRLSLESVGIYSEYPLSQMFGPRCNVQMLAADSYGKTYEEAWRNLCANVMGSPCLEWAREAVAREVRSFSGTIHAVRGERDA